MKVYVVQMIAESDSSVCENEYSVIVPRIAHYLKNNNLPLIFKNKYKLFAVGGKLNRVHVFSNSLELMTLLKGHSKSITCLQVLSSSLLASASWDSTIKIWDFQSKTMTISLSGYTGSVNALCHPRPKILISGSYYRGANSLTVWNLGEPSTPPRILIGHTSNIRGIIKIDNEHVVSGGIFEDRLLVWNIEEGTCIRELPGIQFLTQMKNFKGHLACSTSKSFLLCEPQTFIPIKQQEFVNGGSAIELLSNNILARGLDSGWLQIVDIEAININPKRLTYIIILHDNKINDILRLAPNILALIASDGIVKVFDIKTKTTLVNYTGHNGYLLAISKFI